MDDSASYTRVSNSHLTGFVATTGSTPIQVLTPATYPGAIVTYRVAIIGGVSCAFVLSPTAVSAVIPGAAGNDTYIALGSSEVYVRAARDAYFSAAGFGGDGFAIVSAGV